MSGQPLHVVYIVDRFPSLSEAFVAREIEALETRGVTVRVVARRPPAADAPPGRGDRAASVCAPPVSRACLGAFARLLRADPRRLGRAVAELRRRTPPTPRRWKQALGSLLTAVKAAEAAAGGTPIAHVHAQFAFYPADMAAVMAAILDTRFSVSVHARDLYVQRDGELRRRLAGAAFVTVCTDRGRRRLEAVLAARPHPPVHLVRHGIFPARFPAAAPAPAARLVLGVGRLEPKKGFAHLVAACRLLRDRGADFTCTIAGDGPLRADLARRIARDGLEDRVTLAGAMAPERLATLYRQAAVVVLPSVIAADGDRDGLANVLLEAMAWAVPVVSTTVSAADEAVEDGRHGFLVPPRDSLALADRIGLLLGDAALRAQLGTGGRRRVLETFDARSNAGTLARLFARQARREQTPCP
jgi:glycosyltransferase involved in cell wall biosynthesis